MEFDIGTLIYIIITIIAIVAGVAGKKKTPAGNTGASEGGSKSFFEKLEEKIGGFVDEAKETTGSVTEEIRAPFTEEEPVMEREVASDDNREQDKNYWRNNSESAYDEYAGEYDPDQQENLEQIASEAIRSTNESDMLQVIDMDESYHPDYYEIVREFDLGTAVIYSSIINRKEY